MNRIVFVALLSITLFGLSHAEYFLGPADKIAVHVLTTTSGAMGPEPNISGNFVVDPDGNISMHLIGSVHVSGMTPDILRHHLMDRLGEYLKHPDVTVNVNQAMNSRYIVLGQVRFPGIYDLSRATTALDALANAGGHHYSALLWNVKIIRGNLANPTILNINLERVLKEGDLSQNIQLQSGDIVFIPKTFVWRFNELIGQINPAMNSLVTGATAADRLR